MKKSDEGPSFMRNLSTGIKGARSAPGRTGHCRGDSAA
jgi:hypothetical protein